MSILSVGINKKIFKSSTSEHYVLNNVYFEVSEKDFISILGRSGSGKSTLLKIILGTDEDFTGSLIKNFTSNTSYNFGIVFQEHRLLPWLRVEDNVGFALPKTIGRSEYKERIKNLLELMGLAEHGRSWIRELSGGMQQRVALARALINLPKILLLDEPFGALDFFTKFEMQKLLKKITTEFGVTCIMVTHDLDEAISLSNKIIVLKGSPSTISKVIRVNLKDPFDKFSEQFMFLRKEITKEFYAEHS